ncbi:unnamed protein product, partial [Mycena citricolor]
MSMHPAFTLYDPDAPYYPSTFSQCPVPSPYPGMASYLHGRRPSSATVYQHARTAFRPKKEISVFGNGNQRLAGIRVKWFGRTPRSAPAR